MSIYAGKLSYDVTQDSLSQAFAELWYGQASSAANRSQSLLPNP